DVHRIGTGGASIDAAKFGDGASLEQQTFSQAGLARVNMRQDSEIECAQGTTAPGVGSGLLAGQLPHASGVPPGEPSADKPLPPSSAPLRNLFSACSRRCPLAVVAASRGPDGRGDMQR